MYRTYPPIPRTPHSYPTRRSSDLVMQGPAGSQTSEAEIYTFLAAAGGAGVTTLAIQTALLLRNSPEKARPSTCLVDLDFQQDRKSTRLNSSHMTISYAVFCLKKKK